MYSFFDVEKLRLPLQQTQQLQAKQSLNRIHLNDKHMKAKLMDFRYNFLEIGLSKKMFTDPQSCFSLHSRNEIP